MNGVSLGPVATHTFTDIRADHTISATFARNAFTIFSRAEGGGVVSPSGIVTVSQGESQTFAIMPNEGCHVADVLADGVSVGPAAAYTFANVTAGHTLQALFAADATFSAADLAGEWRLAGIAAGAAMTTPYGAIEWDANAQAISGAIAYPERAAEAVIEGGLDMDSLGLITAGGWRFESGDGFNVGSGKLSEGKALLSFVGQSRSENPEWLTAMKSGAVIYPEAMADLSGTWQLFGFRVGKGAGPLTGTLILDAAGGAAEESMLTFPGQKPEAVTGSLAGGLETSMEILTLDSGQIDAGRAFMIWTDSGKSAHDLFLAAKAGGSFPRAFLAGTWHVAGIEAETTWRGTLTLTGEGAVTGGSLVDVRGSETVVTGGTVDMAATGIIAGSTLILAGDKELAIDRGKMAYDRDRIVWTMASPSGAQALMLLLRGEPPR